MTHEELQQTLVQIGELLNRNRFEQAKRHIKQASVHFPDDEDLLYFGGFVAMATGRLDEAEEHIARLLQASPASYQGRALMADIFEQQEKFAQSEQLYLGLLHDYPDDAHTMADYAMLMLRTLHVEKAAKLAEEALRRQPDLPSAIQVATLAAVVCGEADLRDERLAEMIHKHPELQATTATLAQVLYRKGRYKEALHVSQEMLRADPGNQDIVDMVISQRLFSHWSMIPMRPLIRFGWPASVALWFAAVGLFRILPDSPATDALLVLLLLFVVYTWVWPWALRKILSR